jgi:hypothetical protein
VLLGAFPPQMRENHWIPLVIANPQGLRNSGVRVDS